MKTEWIICNIFNASYFIFEDYNMWEYNVMLKLMGFLIQEYAKLRNPHAEGLEKVKEKKTSQYIPLVRKLQDREKTSGKYH